MPNFSSWKMPALPNDLELPPLPEVSNKAVLQQAMTHSSFVSRPREQSILAQSEITDYEKLEHIGDTLLGTVVTLLLNERHPNLREVSATILKAQLVKNETLAQLSARYKLWQLVRSASQAQVRMSESIQADIFESYIAAVFYSSCPLPPGPSVPTPPLTPSGAGSAPPLPPWPANRTNRAGYEAVEAWLIPLYQPLVDFAFQALQQEVEKVTKGIPFSHEGADLYEKGRTEAEISGMAKGIMAVLNEYCVGRIKTGLPSYIVDPIGDQHAPLFKVICSATDSKNQQHAASAIRPNTHHAKSVAAWKVAQMMGIIDSTVQ